MIEILNLLPLLQYNFRNEIDKLKERGT